MDIVRAQLRSLYGTIIDYKNGGCSGARYFGVAKALNQ